MVIFHDFCLLLAFFFCCCFFNIISGIPSKFQTGWIQIRKSQPTFCGALGPNGWQSLSADKTSRQREKNAAVPVIMQPLETKSAEQRVQPRSEKTCLWVFGNNTCTDQPAHPRSLISTFVFGFLESIICKLATGKISFF